MGGRSTVWEFRRNLGFMGSKLPHFTDTRAAYFTL
jgi:hypothetical protein